jgi:hypothetical protein
MIFVPHGKTTLSLAFLALVENIPIALFGKSKIGHGVTQELEQCRALYARPDYSKNQYTTLSILLTAVHE